METLFESIEEAVECYCDLENVWRNEAASQYWNTASMEKGEFIEFHVEKCRRMFSLSD